MSIYYDPSQDPADYCEICQAELYGPEAEEDEFGILCDQCRKEARLQQQAEEEVENNAVECF